MVIGNWITEEEVEAALNVVPPRPSSYVRFLEKLLEGIGPPDKSFDRSALLREWVDHANRSVRTRQAGFVLNYLANAPIIRPPSPSQVPWRLPDKVSRQESVSMRTALTSAHLRQYVDAWLETGQNQDGSEWPTSRDLYRAPSTFFSVEEYLEKYPTMFSPEVDSHGFRLTVAQRNWPSPGARDFFEAQQHSALRLLVGLLASDWKGRLCKCRYSSCGRYFLHPRPRKSYRRGTFCCREHASSAAASASMLKSRAHGHERLIEAAARKLMERKIVAPDWQDDADLKRDLAGKLCLVIARQNLHGYREQVRLNWVTRYQAMIEQKRMELLEIRRGRFQ